MVALADVVPCGGVARIQGYRLLRDVRGKTDRVFSEENIPKKEEGLRIIELGIYVLA